MCFGIPFFCAFQDDESAIILIQHGEVEAEFIAWSNPLKNCQNPLLKRP